jgi:hypothetical protein
MVRKMNWAGFVALAGLATSSASAQIFYRSPDFSGAQLTALDPGFDPPMAKITLAETNAVFIWHLRSALNLAALQCDFARELRATSNYNALLNNHKEELASAYASIEKYYARTKKPKSAAQKALDTFGTRTISKYSTVRGQLGFCETAGRVGLAAKFAPRGTLGAFAQTRLPELRASLLPAADQQFRRAVIRTRIGKVPNGEPSCWNAKRQYNASCGY